MADKKIKLDLEVATKDAQKNLKDAAKEAKKLGDTVDDTRTAGKKAADAYERIADQIEKELGQAKRAGAALEKQLGPELSKALADSGNSVDQQVAQFRKLGLSYEYIENDAESLAKAVKRFADVSESAGNTSVGAIRHVEEQSGKARDTMHSFTGNAIAELPGVTDSFGPLGEAVSQMTEGLLAGEIGFGGLLSAAAPIAGIAVGVVAVTKAIEMMGRREKEVKREAELLVKVQGELADQQYAQAASELYDEYGDLITVLKSYGFTTSDVVRALRGEIDLRPKLNQLIEENNLAQLNGQKAYDGTASKLKHAGEELGIASDAYERATKETQNNITITRELEAALRSDLSPALQGLTKDERDARDEAERLRRKTDKLNEGYEILLGTLNQEEAWDNLKTDLADIAFGSDTAEVKARNMAKAYAEFITEADNIPAEVKSQLLVQLNEGDFHTVQTILENWKKGITVPVRFPNQGSVGFEKRAKGGPVKAGEPYIVGEQGPELMIPGTSGTIVPNHGLGTYNDHRNIYIQVPPMSPSDLTKAVLRDQLRNGTY